MASGERPGNRVRLWYQGGTIVSEGAWIPFSKWDERVGGYRALAMYYSSARRYLDSAGYSVQDEVLQLERPGLEDRVTLRGFQEDALRSWESSSMRGIVVLPTGTGKTFVALKAMAKLGEPTLIVVPTLDLQAQWSRRIEEDLGYEPGLLGGGAHVLRPVTVATYDSARIHAEELGNRFGLLVFDEVHHLPAQSYRAIAELSAAPHRLGLSATPEREDGLHELYPMLVGGIVYRADASALAGSEISPFRIQRVYVDLLPEERARYEELEREFSGILRRLGIRLRGTADFRGLVRLAARSREARTALLDRLEMSRIAMNSEAKIAKLREILAENAGAPTIVFTRYNDMAYRVSREFLVPVITHETPKDEREELLEGFRTGRYRVLATSTVLDEGVDVPDAALAVVLGGFGTTRQFVQRLGRILRKREGKVATMIEIVARGTLDYRLSRRRRLAARESAAGEG
ncbi:MAG: DEAD/DEAH box helicase [Conexivisphaera sp.]